MIELFTDPIFFAPTLGCMLMAVCASLVGVLVFVRRRSLLGETLSHCTYPGVIIALALGAMAAPLVLAGAATAALLGLLAVEVMERKLNVRHDSALCFVLAAFFGIGITIASRLQFTHPIAYRRTEMYLYGQAATMTDGHIYLYAGLCLVVVAAITLFYKEILAFSFDRDHARSVGLKPRLTEALIFSLIVIAVVTGIRSVGVVLMSAMLIAPPIAARQFTNRLSHMLLLSAIFGLLSGLLGSYFSVRFGGLPTGPIIVLVAAAMALLSMCIAPNRGLLFRAVRAWRFRYSCVQENVLKCMWRFGRSSEVPMGKIAARQAFSRGYLRVILAGLVRADLISKESGTSYRLTPAGFKRAEQIVRLHRLWEVYLVQHLGASSERVHHNAEEMEHILAPLEGELVDLLNNPQLDPHAQPIPGSLA